MLQLLGYVGRYGPGLVIYWAGHVDYLTDPVPVTAGVGASTAPAPATSIHPDIVVAADLPAEFVWPGARTVTVFKPRRETSLDDGPSDGNLIDASDELFHRRRASTTQTSRSLTDLLLNVIHSNNSKYTYLIKA
jgi:hypothetical protein